MKVSVEYSSDYLLMTIHDVTREGDDIEISIDRERYTEMYVVDGDMIVDIPEMSVLKDTRRFDRVYEVVKDVIDDDNDERIRRFCEHLVSEYDKDFHKVYYDDHFRTVVFVSDDVDETEFDIADYDDFDR